MGIVFGRGASEAIIKALENSMEDFNNNLKEHFGENFKQLNEACEKMIQWQEEYKNQVEQGTKHIDSIHLNSI